MIHQMGRSRDRKQVGAGRGCVMQTGCFSGGMGCSETSGSCTHCDCTKCRRTVLVACRKISPQFKKKKDTRPQSTLARFVKCCRVLRGPGNNPGRDRGGGGLRKERQKAGSGGRRPLTTERAATSGFHARARVCRLTGVSPPALHILRRSALAFNTHVVPCQSGGVLQARRTLADPTDCKDLSARTALPRKGTAT